MAAAMAGWAGGQTRIDMRTQGKNMDFSTAASTRPSKTGTLVPAACAIGETFLKTDAPGGKNLYVCTAQNVWAAQGVDAQLPGAGGDLSGTLTGATVVRMQSRPIAATTPVTGQVLTWDGNQWAPTASSGGGNSWSQITAATWSQLKP